jgi:hypothetical protein
MRKVRMEVKVHAEQSAMPYASLCPRAIASRLLL